MKYLEENLKALEKINPNLAEKIKNTPINSNVYQVIEAKREGLSLKINQTWLNSSINPYKETEKNLKNLWEENLFKKETLILLGSGFGHQALYLLEKIKNSQQIWVIDGDIAILKLTLMYHNFTEAMAQNKIFFFHISELAEAQNLAKQTQHQVSEIIIHRPSDQLQEGFLKQIKDSIQAFFSLSKINQDTIRRFQDLWVKNTLFNMENYLKYSGLEALKNHLKGLPFMILGAGPSLNDQIKDIKNSQQKLILIASNTVVGFLLHHQIIPDFILAIDPQDKLFYHFIPLFQQQNSLKKLPILVVEPTLSPKIIRNYKGATIFIKTSFLTSLTQTVAPEKAPLDSGGSVITTAYSLALFFEPSRIIFVGADLSYHNKHTHCQENELEKTWFFDKQNRFNSLEKEQFLFIYKDTFKKHEGISGEEVLVNHQFRTYIEWLENRFQYYQESFPTVNASLKGIQFKNILHLPLYKAVEGLDDISAIKHLLKAKENLNKEKDFYYFYESLSSELKKVEDSRLDLLKGIEICEELHLKALKKNRIDQKKLDFLDKLDKKINTFSSLEILSLPLQDLLHQIEEDNIPLNEKEKDIPLIKNLKTSLLLYSGIEKSFEKINGLKEKLLQIKEQN